MRSLAEYIMRGRFQAFSIALLGGLVPLFSQGALGLVTLRKGWQEGFFVTLWAFLPVLAQLWLGEMHEVSTAVVYASIGILAVTFVACLVLRTTISWMMTMLVVLIVSALSAFAVFFSIENLVEVLQASFEELEQKAETKGQFSGTVTAAQVTGVIAACICFGSLVGLCFSRWLQAILYNPGGFREEFHGLRLKPQLAAICAVGLALSFYAGGEYEYWGMLFCLPMFFAGLGLIHNLVSALKLNWVPLAVMYVSFPLNGVTMVVVVVFGLTDAWINYRKFLAKKSQ